ncbi:MAG: DUF6484 domain-containing protein [Hydrogenophaga sp.]|jgi:hypothetical protein|nr:DUF6484 domain-containing protein [Hydrogenophaga sp.]
MTKTRSPSKTTVSPSGETKAIVQTTRSSMPRRGLVVGSIDGTTCWVTYPENPSAQAQRAAVLKHVGEVLPGQSVLLQFVSGDMPFPIVAGILPEMDATTLLSTLAPDALAAPVTLEINGDTLTLSARQRITLRCGKASLVMNADGSIELRGTELLSRASGQNAVRGASVSLN